MFSLLLSSFPSPSIKHKGNGMIRLEKLSKGDRVAVVSLSFCAPQYFPEVYEVGLERMKPLFGLDIVEYPSTRDGSKTYQDRLSDLMCAFSDSSIKAIFASIGGDHQVEFIYGCPELAVAAKANPKPFFGFSDNTHLCNLLWLSGIPSYYGGHVMMQFACHGAMNEYTINYLKQALFQPRQQIALTSSSLFNEVDVEWAGAYFEAEKVEYRANLGWTWHCASDEVVTGITWGGCVESIDDILRSNSPMPSLNAFENVVLLLETSEEVPPVYMVRRVVRALGLRGILHRCKAFLIGRAKAWFFDKPIEPTARDAYRTEQYEAIVQGIRAYNPSAPIVCNVDFGHTEPQICMPYGGEITINPSEQSILSTF